MSVNDKAKHDVDARSNNCPDGKVKGRPGGKVAGRQERLAAQLRANLKKRKAQARGRAIAEVADAPACPDENPSKNDSVS